MSTKTSVTTSESRTITVSFLAFIGLGLTSGLLGLAWPSMQKAFDLPLDGVNILYLVSTAAYTLASFAIGRLMARFGSGTTLLVGSILISLCMFGIATSSLWVLVIAFTMIAGFGSGLLDAGLNMYIGIYHSARQMNWLHASFGIGITFGPLIMTFVLQHALGWQVGYAVVGALLISIILLFVFTRSLWRTEGLQTADNTPVVRENFSKTLRVPIIWLSMLTYLVYCGLEIGLGQWAYTLLTQSRGIAPEIAGPWVAVYWGTFTGGRIIYGAVANRFEIDRVLRVCTLGMIVGAGLFWWNPVNAVGLLGLVVIGAAQAPVFPLLMSGTAKRVGAVHAENGISLQMGAVGIGTALLPGLIGTVGKNFGLESMSALILFMAVVVFILHELINFYRVKPVVAVSAAD